MKTILFVLTIFVCSMPSTVLAAQETGRLISPTETVSAIVWTAEEQSLDIANRTLFRSQSSSHHLLRLAKNEVPHTHPNRDLTVFVLSGEIKMHYDKKARNASKGDVVFVPHGQIHWAEIMGQKPSIAYAIFSEATVMQKEGKS